MKKSAHRFTERRDHLEFFAANLRNFTRHLIVLRGGMGIKERRRVQEHTGRLHRLHPGKTEVRIFDYVDRDVPMLLRMFQRRLRGYWAIGYARGERPNCGLKASDRFIVEYDVEAGNRTDAG